MLFMKNQISKYLFIALIIIFIILFATLIYIKFFNDSKKNEYEILAEKVEGEVKYLDNTIIELMNKLNNISYTRYQVTIKEVNESEQLNNSSSNSQSAGNGMQTTEQGNSNQDGNKSSGDNSSGSNESESINQSEARTSRLAQVDSLLNSNYEDISWDEVSYGVETIYTSWPSISLDMKALNIDNSDISSFSSAIDGVAQAVKLQDKNSTLINLYNLYILLPKYLSYFVRNEYILNIYNVKAYVLSAYVSANSENWEDMNKSVTNAIDTLSKNMQSINIEDTQKSSIEKSYALLEDLKRGVGLEDKEIFYLKYKLAMEQLEIL